LKPRGRLADSRLEWSGPFDAPTRMSARSRFSDLALRPRDGVPGFSGLAGTLEATEAKGSVSLNARKAEVDLPGVFPAPRLPLETLHGRIEWQRQADGILVTLPSLAFSNTDLSGVANGTHLYTGAGPGVIDLSVLLNRFDGAQIDRYLPHGSILGEGTRDWLVKGVRAADASDVRLRLRGDLRQFPFVDPASGEFRVAARLERGVLSFAEGWPEIRDIDAEMVFERSRMDIAARSASILGARVANTRVSIPEIKPGARLLVSGQAEGPTAEFLRYLRESPLSRATHGFTDAMSATGNGGLRLKLDVPLDQPEKAAVQGEFAFAGNDVTLHPQMPPIERAGGRVGFTESALSVHDVRGRLLGGAVTIAGGPRKDGATEVVARGAINLREVALQEPWRRYLTGSASYVGRVVLSEGRASFSLDSPLVGVTSTLPAPLAKAAPEALPLSVQFAPGDGSRDRISLTLGRLAAAEVQRRRQGEAMVVQRAAVWMAPTPGQPIRLPERPGVLLYGSIAALDLDRWLALEGSGSGGGSAASLDVRVAALDAFGKRFNGVAVRAGSDANGWSATLSSQEAAGDLNYRYAGGGRLTARLERLRVPEDAPGPRMQGARAPANLPAVDLVAENFVFRDKPLGRFELQAQRAGADWRVDKLAMTNPDAALSAKGLWRRGAAARTTVEFTLNATDAGRFLDRIGNPGLVRGGKVAMQGSLAWNGEPTEIDYGSLGGDLQMQAEDGQFLEVDPGLGKLVSLMNLQALPRRVALDFRDVFSKGFQFDRITSGGHVERGVMELHEFRMRGSAAQVEMRGSVDLARETQDLKVRIIPSLGDSASAALYFINPLLIFPAAVAQRILKDPLGHIFSFEYAVTGTWSNPNVQRTSVDARAVVPNDAR
ncbi:MAG TPA: YhdP family protein, partial [Burkholderiales bacterium]